MRSSYAVLTLTVCLAAVPLLAQPQIGGGVCSSATLSGSYSLTLTGRDLGTGLTFNKVSQGIGTATFDGLNKVTLSLTNNTNQNFNVAETLSGTYTMQANCIGSLTITSGDTATFSIESFNEGKNYLITGQDGTFSFSGNGGSLPATCSASLLSGFYSFNGSGFGLTAGAVSSVNNISGVLQFDGKSAVSGTWYVATGASNTTATVSGQFSITAGCTATATVADVSGNSYSLLFTVTAANGSNFLIGASSNAMLFTGSGRTL